MLPRPNGRLVVVLRCDGRLAEGSAMDRLTADRRSALMSRVRAKNTRPEIAVRRELHRRGFRFRVHRAGLPGRPDIVLPRWRAVIFVHGCFWHRHVRCRKTTTPGSNRAFWLAK